MFTTLVVEDDVSLNKMICTKLNREQYRAIPAFDGEEALDKKYIKIGNTELDYAGLTVTVNGETHDDHDDRMGVGRSVRRKKASGQRYDRSILDLSFRSISFCLI